MKLNVVIGIKHFKRVIMMTNLLDSSTLSDKISDNTKSSGNTQEKKNRKILTKKKETKIAKKTVIKENEENGKCEVQIFKERKGNLDEKRKRKKIVLFSNSILKNYQMKEF